MVSHKIVKLKYKLYWNDSYACFFLHRKVLLGSMVVTSYNQPQVSADVKPPYLASFFNTVEATPTSDVCVLHPEQGNIHEIKAQE